MDKSRYAAAAGIVRLHRGGWANLTSKTTVSAGLSPAQKAFANALFYGTAERLVTLQALLQPYSKQPLAKLDTEVRAILETGLYQMLYMQVPARAAVDEAVKLARAFKKASAAGFVNAVLRKAQHANPEELSFASELERMQVVYSVSAAVAAALMQAMPQSYEAFLKASFSRPALCLRVNTLKTTEQELARLLREKGAEVWPGALPGCLYTRLPGGVAGESLFEQGLYHVQGEASQFACACLAPGGKTLDLCAAPGGKAATLAQYLGGGQALTACDVRLHRLPLITETLQRLGIAGVQVLQNDASVYSAALEGQTAVLCDVPCSGLGVLASKPDLRYASGENFGTLPPLQSKILATASRYVKRGGRLVYSTCTVRPQENTEVVRQFLQNNPAFKVVSPPVTVKGAQEDEKMVTILPQFTGLDGFFVVTLERL
ncbi:MAG: 16S rRNA (cytosine(967)-C(5))-methyltransferase RsmB [Oscillospiraceae bacterium]